MELQRTSLGYVSPRDLSRVPGFALGPIAVDPPTRTISTASASAVLEPRVMQVLAALGLDPGQVLSRDDLIALCWDGRVVGDNAIDRVISLLRQALADVAGDTVRLETITKVGFRLVVSAGRRPPDQSEHAPATPGLRLHRRTVIGAAAVLTAAGGASAFFALRKPDADPRALQLAGEADLLMKSGLPGTTRQAMRNLERAVAIDPEFADGWGYLALMYRHALQGFSAGERGNFPRMVDSAASRALALDGDQPDALLALALKRPFFGRWLEAERELRAILAKFPGHWYANAQLALLLMDVGRAAEALSFRERVHGIDPKIPVSWGFLALNQLMANRLHEADNVLDQAFAIWPNHPALWFTRHRILLETGRPLEAAAFVRAPQSRPDNLPAQAVSFAETVVEGIAGENSARKAEAVTVVRATLQSPEAAESHAPLLAMLGEQEAALAAAVAYYRGGVVSGTTWPAPDSLAMRSTAWLFYPSFRALAHRPEYAELLRTTKLEEHWSQSGSQPDFRRN